MKTNLLSPDKDPMGAAIADYFNHRKADKLRVFSSQFEEDEIPMNQLFRPYDEMPELEQIALQIAEGNILDVGAGSGCHALALQEMGKEVCAIDISPLSVEVMEKRGVKNVRQSDKSFRYTFSRNIRYNHHADERIGHYREVGKYGSFLSKDETTASPRGMYLDGFQ